MAGTLVRTLEGSRPIETLVVGDRVLSQDAATGELSFQSIQVVHHNSPGATLRIAMDNGEELAASVYHRFWRAGKGWAMARELKAGDVLRTLDGLTRVVSVSEGAVEPLFNLDVASSRTFFVGNHAALVHDNTLPDAHLKPFDAQPVLAARDAWQPLRIARLSSSWYCASSAFPDDQSWRRVANVLLAHRRCGIDQGTSIVSASQRCPDRSANPEEFR